MANSKVSMTSTTPVRAATTPSVARAGSTTRLAASPTRPARTLRRLPRRSVSRVVPSSAEASASPTTIDARPRVLRLRPKAVSNQAPYTMKGISRAMVSRRLASKSTMTRRRPRRWRQLRASRDPRRMPCLCRAGGRPSGKQACVSARLSTANTLSTAHGARQPKRSIRKPAAGTPINQALDQEISMRPMARPRMPYGTVSPR